MRILIFVMLNPTSRDAHPLAINAFGLATGHSTLKAIAFTFARIGIKQVETAQGLEHRARSCNQPIKQLMRINV